MSQTPPTSNCRNAPIPKIRLGAILSILLVSAVANAQQPQSGKPAAGDRPEAQDSAATQEKKPRAAGSAGSIKGRVVEEGNRPVADASVTAIPANIGANPQSIATSMFRPITSDADGKFEVSGLQLGAYKLSASAPGYVLSDSGSNPYYRPGESVTLTLAKGGVITGRVTNLSGDPVVGAVVRAIKIREADNKPVRFRGDAASVFADSIGSLLGPYKTDDRGIYRIYGLEAGFYQVAAGGRRGPGIGVSYPDVQSSARRGQYDSDAPTYFPSGTIDTAAEVTVRAGEEATNIDIRYRDNRGHSVSGAVSGGKGPRQDGIAVTLTRASSGIVEATTYVFSQQNENGFVFDALLDGEYLVTAMAGSGSMIDADGLSLYVSPSRTVTVSGADVTGVELTLEPLASMAGLALIEPISAAQKAECKAVRRARLEEIVIGTRTEGKKPVDQSAPLLSMFKDASPNEKGQFTVRFLRAGVHRLDLQLPGDGLYIRTITLPPPTPDGKPVDAAKLGVRLKPGDKVMGLVVTMSEGAAGLRGKATTGEESKPPLAKMRVHLVPAEPEAADNVLRYFEAEVAADGAFAFAHISPGKYRLIARELSDQELTAEDHKPLAWGAGGRTSLKFEADTSKKTVELSPCQRVTDLVVSYTPLVKPSKRPVK